MGFAAAILIAAAALALLRTPTAVGPLPAAPTVLASANTSAASWASAEVLVPPRELVADAESPAAEAIADAADRDVAVRGVVVDAAGDPVPTGFVSVLAAGGADAGGAAIAVDGTFALPRMTRGFYRLIVESPLRPTLVFGPVLLDASVVEAPLRLRLPHPATLRGAVGPLASQETACVVCVDAGGIERRAPVGPNGRFALDGLSPGPHRVRIETAARAAVAVCETVYLAEGETRDAEFALPRR